MSIFVFGSNLAGRHGAGAALDAIRHHGAIYGQGVGRQGLSYAIPTKDWRMEALPLPVIAKHIADFIAYAKAHPDEHFFVTRIGCGFAGYIEAQISPFFADAPSNCDLPRGWTERGAFVEPGDGV